MHFIYIYIGGARVWEIYVTKCRYKNVYVRAYVCVVLLSVVPYVPYITYIITNSAGLTTPLPHHHRRAAAVTAVAVIYRPERRAVNNHLRRRLPSRVNA